MNGTLLNILMAILAVGLVIFITKKKKLSYKNDIGLILPKWKEVVFWTSLFVLLIFIEDYMYQQFSTSKTDSWIGKYSVYEMVFRSLGIVIIAPIAEELMFRGLLYARIKKSPLKIVGAIIIPALFFSMIHIQYSDILTLSIIFIDGLFYGLARHYSKSVIFAIFLHSLANFGAILERTI